MLNWYSSKKYFYIKVLQNLKRLFSQIIYLVASFALMPSDISIV